MGLSLVRTLAIAFSLIFIAPTPSAFANAVLKFCDIDTETGCVVAFIKNRSSADVMSVDVTQKARHGCEKRSRKIRRNLSGGANEGTRLRIHVRQSCRYDVKFNAQNGCAGHKAGTFSRKNLKNRRRQINLHGPCRFLQTQTVRPPFYNRDVGQPDS